MTDAEIKEALTEWAKDYCNNQFLVDGITVLPSGVELFLDQAVSATIGGVKSESLGDYSVTFHDEVLSNLAKQYLRPYKRVKFV